MPRKGFRKSVLKRKIIDSKDWKEKHSCVFRDAESGKFYEVYYSDDTVAGLLSWHPDNKLIPCCEVEQVEVLVKKWRVVERTR